MILIDTRQCSLRYFMAYFSSAYTLAHSVLGRMPFSMYMTVDNYSCFVAAVHNPLRSTESNTTFGSRNIMPRGF